MSRSDPDARVESGAAGRSMLARRWTIAARFRTPADAGIPERPALPAERTDEGVALYAPGAGPERSTPVLTAESVVDVRR